MSNVVMPAAVAVPPVGHLDLPCDDGAMVHNFQEHPQSLLLTDSIQPIARQLYGDRFTIGQDCAIYYRWTDPPLDGAKAPDWFFLANVDQLVDGAYRRSYVLWRERVAPLIVLEFVSGDGSEERDNTPETGKFWAYEQVIRPMYYGIFDSLLNDLEMYHHVGDRFERMEPNAQGRYPIPPLPLELGLRFERYLGLGLPWLRWWSTDGELVLTNRERVDVEQQRAEHEKQRADRLTEQLRQLGVDPDSD